MVHKCLSELLCMIVDVFGKEEHYRQPYVIGSYLYIPVLQISIVKSFEKTILALIAQMTAFFVRIDSMDQVFLPQSVSIFRWIVEHFSGLKLLDANSFEAFVDSVFRDRRYFLDIFLLGLERFEHLFEEEGIPLLFVFFLHDIKFASIYRLIYLKLESIKIRS